MVGRERVYKRAFGVLILLILVLGFQQILASPTAAEDNRRFSPVIVSEFVTTGGARLLDEENEPVDWIELHNRSGQAVDLYGWSLTDDPAKPDKWVFLSLVLPAGG